METIYPPYDLIVIALLTFFGGLGIRLILRRADQHRLAGSWFPFAVAYIVLTLMLAFIWDDLPLKFYRPEKPHDFNTQNNSTGPDIGAGLTAGMTYILSVITNLGFWGLSLFLIIKSVIVDNRNRSDLR